VQISGRVELKFKNGENTIAVAGEKISLASGQRQILIEGGARLIDGQNVLKAKRITIDYNPENGIETIVATDSVSFAKDDMEGGASRLQWDFPRKLVFFRDSARIARKNGGETTGRELKLNLETNEILVLGETDRSETIIK
jgi:lipopolysaccharide transport protein LptA